MLLAGSTYGVGQGANFLFQLLLLKLLGASEYGVVGLAHLLLITLIFLADLGYSSLFLRETGRSAEWQRTWRFALGHRVTATVFLTGLVVIGWQFWSDNTASRQYLLSAAPACFFALFNFSSPMIAAGQRLTGLLVAQIAWPVALVFWWLLWESLSLPAAVTAGFAVSLGYLVQAIANVAYSRQLMLWLPLVGKGQIGAAWHLSIMGVFGTLHDRLTPFLLAPLAPNFLPFYLILNHILSGLSGVQSQLSRLLLADAASEQGRAKAVELASMLIWVITCLMLSALLLQGLELSDDHRQGLALGAIVIMAWGLSASSGFLVVLLVSVRLEGRLVRPLLIALSGSALLQVLAAGAGEASYLLWARLLGMLMVVAALLVVLKLPLTPWGVAALSGSLVACAIANTSWAVGLGVIFMLLTLVGLFRQLPCYRAPSRIGVINE